MTDDLARKLLDIEEIKNLKARYFRLLDAKEWDEWTDVFTDDLEFVYADPTVMNVPPTARETPDGALVNRAQLVESVSEAMKRVTTIHLGHVPEITLIDENTATGRWGLTNYCEYTGTDGLLHWLAGYGHYHEVYARTASGWRIQRSIFYRRDMVDGAPPR